MPDPAHRPLVFLAGEYLPDQGGLADYTVNLRQALARLGVSSEVVTCQARTKPRSESGIHRPVRRWDLPTLVRVVRRLAVGAILHVQYQPAAFDLRGEVCLLPLLIRRLRPDVRLVTTFHDARIPYIFHGAGPLRLRAVQTLARGSHAAIAAANSDLDTLHVQPWRAYRVPIGSNITCSPPPGYNREAFRTALGLGPSDLAVAYFGFLNASKGLDTLVQAFRQVTQAMPAARLLLLGGSTGASDATDIATANAVSEALSGLGDRLDRPGYLAPSELSAHLLAADVALLPYEDGASPRRGSLLACLAHGLPVVSTTPDPGSAALLEDGLLAAPPGDASGLARQVLIVAGSPETRARLVSAAGEITRQTSWPTIAATHLGIYARVSDER